MIMEHEERHRDEQSIIKWYGFQFYSDQRKSAAVFMLRLETTGEITSVGKLRKPLIHDWASCGPILFPVTKDLW